MLLIVAVVVVAVIAGSAWWLNGADERRVNAACDTWLHHRDSLRAVLTETQEAVERADSADAVSAVGYFNDVDTTRAAITQWARESPRVLESLDQSDGASQLERGATFSLDSVQSGLVELQGLIDESPPEEVAYWLPAVEAQFQNVDDVCLAAARGQ